MNYKFSKLFSLSLLMVLLIFPSVVGATSLPRDTSMKIPTKMEPGTIIRYDENSNPLITKDTASSTTFS